MKSHWMLVVPLVSGAFALSGCLELGRTVDTEGVLSASLASRSGGALLGQDVVRGPARFRRLSLTSTLCVMRFVRGEGGSYRRGELFLRLVTPFGVRAGANFFGDLEAASATYVETSPSGERSTFTVTGKTRFELLAGATTSFRVGLELELRGAAGGGPRTLTLRGFASSAGSARVTADFGAGFWSEVLDTVLIADHPTLDFASFASVQGGDWAIASSEAPAGFGHFDFGAFGEITGPANSELPGFDPDFDSDFGSGNDTSFPSVGGGDTPSFDVPSFDDDADGGCQGDKAFSDSSECASPRGGVRGLAYGAVFLGLLFARGLRSRRRR